MLYEKRKFDMRSYLFIANATPIRAFWCPGYIRVSVFDYTLSSFGQKGSAFATHVTNYHVQQQYESSIRRTSRVPWEEFVRYLVSSEPAASDAIVRRQRKSTPNVASGDSELQLRSAIDARTMDLVRKCVDANAEALASARKYRPRDLYFSLLGVDVIMAEDGTMKLLEFTRGCAIRENDPYLKRLHTEMVQEMIDVTFEIGHMRRTCESSDAIRSRDFGTTRWRPL